MKLSIIVTNFNYGHFLKESISSLYKNLSLDSFEVLLVDDGSTDDSDNIIHELLSQYPSIKFFKHKKNLGQEAALDTAFPHVQGEYLHPFAADDIMLPGSLDVMLDYFNKYPDISCFCSDNSYFTRSNPDPVVEVIKTINTQTFHFFSPTALYKIFSHTNFWIPGHTIFAKKDVYLKYTPFDKNLKFINDWWVNHQIVIKEGVGYIPQNISVQRKHSASFSATTSLEKNRAVWLYLFTLLEKKSDEARALYKSGIFRMFGLKAIYKDLILTPRYWKYLWPMCRKILEQKIANIISFDSDRFWLKRLGDK